MKKLILLPLLFLFYFSFSQHEIKIYPANWWVGMKNPHLQLMLHGKDISRGRVEFDPKKNPGITIASIQKIKNPDYLFLNLNIAPNTKPGNIKLNIHF
ncbi:MAG TPA: hypothetical protein DIC22_01150, partial [Chitinophagaceae bacterium]|nr:hypothetical protein [Chitinophagaceae bacterium]